MIDAGAAIALVRRGYSARDGIDLYAPTLLRSQVLALARRELVSDDGDPRAMLELAEAACRLPRRLLGDAVLRSTAWKLAHEQGWPDTYDAESIALTRLHGRALVAEGQRLRARAAGLVELLTVDELLAR